MNNNATWKLGKKSVSVLMVLVWHLYLMFIQIQQTQCDCVMFFLHLYYSECSNRIDRVHELNLQCLNELSSWQHLRSYQDGCWLMTVHTPGDFIVLPHWKSRSAAPWKWLLPDLVWIYYPGTSQLSANGHHVNRWALPIQPLKFIYLLYSIY